MTKTLLVIHAQSLDQVKRNIDIAMSNGSDGVFLINQGSSADQVLDFFAATKTKDLWMGLNLLGYDNIHALQECVALGADGLWMDNGRIDESVPDPCYHLKELHKMRNDSKSKVMIFPGIAFKGQRPVKDLHRVTDLAATLCNVICTSGSGTGSAPDLEKIKLMHSVINGRAKLAVASGIDPQNVNQFLPYLDFILCATGVSQSTYHFDPKKVKALNSIVHGG